MNRKTAVVLFGGQSSEHVVSCMSVVDVINHMNREKYDLLLIGITEDGHWIKTESAEDIESGRWREGKTNAVISPDATKQCVILTEGDRAEFVKVDVVFPVLHGLFGEDGTVQGLLELARIPYVGCGVLASAVSMDKLYTKIVVDDLGVRQAAYVPVMRSDLGDMEAVVGRVEAKFTYPVFVKPSNAGSSKGVARADSREELEAALYEAAKHDRKILVEEMIKGREIECAVFGGGLVPVEASGVGEILAAAEFYDFDAKYYNSDSRTVVNPELPGDAANTVREAAKALFDGGKHRLEGREKEGVRALKELFAGLLGVCALHALTGNGGFLREKMRRLFDRLGDLRGQVAPRAEQTALAAAAQFKNERIERGNVFSQILGRFFHERAHLFLFVSRVEHAQAVCLLVGGDLLRRFHALGEQRDQLIVDLVDLFAIVVQIHSFYLVSFLRASSAS